MRSIASVHEDPEHTKRLRAFDGRRQKDQPWPFPVAEALDTARPVVRVAQGSDWEMNLGDESGASMLDLCRAIGFRAVLSKPVTTAVLAEALHRALQPPAAPAR